MKKILQNTITIITELVFIVLGSIWYKNSKEIEPLTLIIGSSSFLLISILSHLLPDKEDIKKQIVGNSKRKYLDKNFLYNYVSGELTINKVIEDFGQPLVKVEDYVEQEWDNNSKFQFNVYKYKFLNSVVLFTTELYNENIISISLISTDPKHPIFCRYSPSDDDKYFGKAFITQNIIDNSVSYKNENYARWTYSAITSRFGDFRDIKYLYFTYFIYNSYENADEMKDQLIDGICISTYSEVHPIIHFDDYN